MLLRAEFRPSHSSGRCPTPELCLKLLSKGASSLTARVQGFLDVGCSAVWLGAPGLLASTSFPRLERLLVEVGEARASCVSDVIRWVRCIWGRRSCFCMKGVENCNFLSEECCAVLRQVAVDAKGVPQGCLDCIDAVLQPGEECVCPVRWSERVPAHDFSCVPTPACPPGLWTYDGNCSGGKREEVVCVANRSLVRRGPQPW